MALNVGYLTSDKQNDELYTPRYAVEPIMKYIPKDKRIWCPFDTTESEFVKTATKMGYDVVHSHVFEGKDFFEYEPENYDVIVSNPPFSCKDKVLKRLYELKKPFALLLPLNSLQGNTRYKYFKQGIQILCFDKRIGFYTPTHMDSPVEGSPFASAYFCRDILPNDLIIEELIKV